MLMKFRILVSVYLDAKCYSAKKQVFARVIESELSYGDLMTLYRSCRVLFGPGCIVDIKIQDYETV